MTQSGNPWRRRTLLAGGAAVVAAWIVGVPRLLVGGGLGLSFRDLPDLPPFRMLEASGAVSGSGSFLAGLDASKAAPASEQEVNVEVAANPCAALFGKDPDPRLPVAFFSDFNCPSCRILDAALVDYDARRPGTIRIVRHELPLLGAASNIASRAVLAADMQGGYAAMQDRLMRAKLVTDIGYVVAMAASAGLDGQRLAFDMQSPKIAVTLNRSRAIAALFGFYGTPSTVIGRTAFVGAIPQADVTQIIDMELALTKLICGVS